MWRLLLIFLAGGMGCVLRYLMQGWVQRLAGHGFPMGTLVVNVTGCLVIGLFGGLFLGARPLHDDYRFAVMAGLLGGYTTFSAFGWETLELADRHSLSLAMVNVLSSVIIGLLAVWAGRQLGQWMQG